MAQACAWPEARSPVELTEVSDCLTGWRRWLRASELLLIHHARKVARVVRIKLPTKARLYLSILRLSVSSQCLLFMQARLNRARGYFMEQTNVRGELNTKMMPSFLSLPTLHDRRTKAWIRRGIRRRSHNMYCLRFSLNREAAHSTQSTMARRPLAGCTLASCKSGSEIKNIYHSDYLELVTSNR
jgi:hypothetical protein